jgi:Ni,Fe-hydrogenase III small subunit
MRGLTNERAMLKFILEGLTRKPLTEKAPALDDPQLAAMTRELDALARRKLGRSLSIRAVDAGSCNGCELEMHALSNAYYDLERFGLRFVASPRHADVLLVTGVVTKNMAHAVRRAFEATAAPKWVVAAGDCACDGGVFGCNYASLGAVENVLTVDLKIPGCPPEPIDFLRGLCALMK